MCETGMGLSLLDKDNINRYAKRAYDNDEYEFECLITTPKVNLDSFTRVMDLCRKKTCIGNWKNIKDRSKILDITIGYSEKCVVCYKERERGFDYTKYRM